MKLFQICQKAMEQMQKEECRKTLLSFTPYLMGLEKGVWIGG